ncbi:protein of unknown function DUF502 [Flexistipes sinusarabici DSM 4947]|uniref:DUF502 domain-containing protein n=1 Tax=Flexistipes sinusarabici (strain ATCC 49648 / DSM 4947 / MAS 10) TaxID=717231 RepID=F8E716_FLESM|nr:DUF502 domain-containing protein [Flexistipes sinusarabici]AEI14879.1 protein of unknown function DUF502 [Flexistipes sinusarabici DSM 4947]
MHRVKGYLRNTFLLGILTALPIIITYFFLSFIFKKVTGFLIPFIDFVASKSGITLTVFAKQSLSLIVLIFLLFIIGIIAKNYFGKKIISFFEYLLVKIPLVRGVYSSIRQVVETFQVSGGTSFKKVVLLEYPMQKKYSIGFVTKETSEFLNNKINNESYNIFVPTTPNPTSGFILIVPKCEVIELDITIDEGIRFVISAGLISPEAAEKLNSGSK